MLENDRKIRNLRTKKFIKNIDHGDLVFGPPIVRFYPGTHDPQKHIENPVNTFARVKITFDSALGLSLTFFLP